MFNEQAAVFFLSGLKSRAEIDRYEIRHARKLNLTRVQNFFLLRTTLTEEDIASCSRAFRKPKMSGEKSRLIENVTPKSTRAVKK